MGEVDIAKTMVVAGVKFRFSHDWGNGRVRWVSTGRASTVLELTPRGKWFVYAGGATGLHQTPEGALTEARRKALNKETKRHERELKRIARELGTTRSGWFND